MTNDLQEEEAVQMPWLLFKAEEQIFAINSRYVVSIFLLTEENKAFYVAGYPQCIRGLMCQREDILALLDFRVFLGMPSLQEKRQDFDEMLDARKEDHIHWVRELERCIEVNVPFPLAIDPHQCAFGKWYDSYQTKDRVIRHQLDKIEEPHRKLHETAQRAVSCKRECTLCKREKCLQDVAREAAEGYMPRLLALLDETKETFQQQYREMCIVLRDEDSFLGVAVDEILEVENLEIVANNEAISKFHRSKLIAGVAEREEIPGQILVLNEKELFAVLK